MRMMKTALFICTLVLVKAIDYDFVSDNKSMLIGIGFGIIFYELFIERNVRH